MKVQEIITEASPKSKALGALWDPVSRGLGKFFNTEREQLVKVLADRMAEKGKWVGNATPMEAYGIAKNLGPKARELVRKDPDILKDAAKEANKVRATSGLDKAGRAASTALKGTWKGVKSIPEASAKIVSFTGNAAFAEAVLEPVYYYYKVMEVADQYLEAGEIPEGYKQYKTVEEWYKAYREKELTAVISKVAIIFTGGKLAKTLVGIPATGLGKFFSWVGLKSSGAMIASLGPAAGGTAAQVLKDSDIANGFAKMMISNPLGIPLTGIIGGATASALDSTIGKAISAIGSAGVAVADAGIGAVNAVKGDKKEPETATATAPTGGSQSTKPATGTADAGSKTDRDATSTPAPAKPAGDAPNVTPGGVTLAPGHSPINKWIDVGSGFVKDPKTGQIANRYMLGLQ